MGQSERLFYMIDRLLETGHFTRREVSEKFEISEKQVWRDIEFLRTRCPLQGLSSLEIIYSKKDGGYVLDPESRSRLSSWRFHQVFLNAISVERNLSDEKLLSDTIRKDLEFVRYKSYAMECYDDEVFSRLFAAMKKRRRILMHYPQGKVPTRVVEPLILINYGDIWYLLASDVRDDFIMTFSVSRITRVEELEEAIEFSDYPKLERVLDSYGIWYDNRGGKEYVIRFTGWARDTVSHQIWQKDQRGEFDDNGDYVLTFTSSSDVELLSRLLFYGDAAEPLSPPEFVEKYWRKVEAMARRKNKD